MVRRINPGFSVVNTTGIKVAYRMRLTNRDEITEGKTKQLYEEQHEM